MWIGESQVCQSKKIRKIGKVHHEQTIYRQARYLYNCRHNLCGHIDMATTGL